MDGDESVADEEGQNPILSDSKKRPLDIDGENVSPKKSHSASDAHMEGNCHLKILVPSMVAGAIIGKGGETIAQLQKECSARVKMSKANDFYPGTTERVCLITGSDEAILAVLAFIMEKVKEKPDTVSKSSDFDHKSNVERDKQMKILVPNSTAGMIIGKAGAYIKQIKERSGAYVQISQKAKDQSLAERCITVIANDQENLRVACEMILSKVIEDPQRGSCLNISYADINGPVANTNPTGSPFANNSVHSSLGPAGASALSSGPVAPLVNPMSAMSGLGSLLGGGVNLTLNLNSAFAGGGVGNSLLTGQILDHVRAQLRSTGFTDHSIAEVCQAIGILISYGIIGLGLGVSSVGPNGSGNPNSEAFKASTGLSNGSGGPFGPIGTTVATPALNFGAHALTNHVGPTRHADRFNSDATPFDSFRRPSGCSDIAAAAATLPLNTNSFGLGGAALKKSTSQGDISIQNAVSSDNSKKVEVEVGEHIVGAILGPGGKALVEIQHISGTNIQISKKGNYAPGTRNRVVTISGLAPGISTAKFLIEQRINEEEGKRARQNTIVGAIP